MAESNLVETLEEEEKKIQSDSKKEESKSYKEIYQQIISDFSDFLSKRSVYEAAPENSKVLVFNSDLSFKEMVKAFINEDIYCALIYDSKKEFFIGIITISDILFIFEYIINKAQEKAITDYDMFIKEIFSVNKLLITEEEDENNKNINKKEKNFDILKYLTKINYNDYFTVIKHDKKIHILYSISLDASLLDVLKLIYKVGVHRLVVEEKKKKGNQDKKKENDINNLQNNLNNLDNNNKAEKEKNEIISAKEKSDAEKSDKKIKKVKTKKKMSDVEEPKDGEKKVKIKKKVKKKKTEDEELKDKENKDNKDKENNKEIKDKDESEKVIKKKVKKIKKKKTESELDIKDTKDKNKEQSEKKEENEEKKDIDNQKSEKSVKQIEENSNKEVLKLNTEEEQKNNELSSEPQNYTGFVTYETVFDFLIYNYYSMEMKEFDMTLEDLKKIPLNSSFIKPISNYSLINEEVHSSFSKNISTKSDILPILTEDKKEIFGFLFLRDYLFFVSNCASNQNLTNEQFLINMYEGIADEKPYGKERIVYLEYNDEAKKLKIKYLLETINGAPEKKIVLKDIEDGNKLYIISLKSIFDTVVEMNEK